MWFAARTQIGDGEGRRAGREWRKVQEMLDLEKTWLRSNSLVTMVFCYSTVMLLYVMKDVFPRFSYRIAH